MPTRKSDNFMVEPAKKKKEKETANSLPLVQNFSGLCLGQDEFLSRFQISLDQNRLPSSWLFVGPPGSGKRTLCYALACKLFGYKGAFTAADLPKLRTSALFYQITKLGHPEFLVFSAPIYLDQVREVRKRLSYSTFSVSWRVIIFLDVDMMRSECFHALLKLIEEPGLRTLFFLTSSHKNLPATITSRCFSHTLAPFEEKTFCTFLTEILAFNEELSLDTLSQEEIYFFAQGRLGKAMKLIQNNGLPQLKELWKFLETAWQSQKLASLPECLQNIGGNLTFFEETFSLWSLQKRQSFCEKQELFLPLDIMTEKVSTWIKSAQTYHMDTDFIICKALFYLLNFA